MTSDTSSKTDQKQTMLKVSSHDNVVNFLCQNIKNFKFELTGHSITSGQPWNGVTSKSPSNKGEIHVDCGRKGSKDVAKWFANKLDGGQAIGINTSSKDLPDELNFAITGNIIFSFANQTYKFTNVVIGQGHFSGTNNWWYGGLDWSNAGVGPWASAVVLPKVSVFPPNVNAFVVYSTISTSGNNFNLAVFNGSLKKTKTSLNKDDVKTDEGHSDEVLFHSFAMVGSSTSNSSTLLDTFTQYSPLTETTIPKESKNNKFECAENAMIVGRYHKGDENGETKYKSCKMLYDNGSNGGEILLKKQTWTGKKTESNSHFQAPDGYVMTGREHSGDENGVSKIKYAKVYVKLTGANGKTCEIPLKHIGTTDTVTVKESEGKWAQGKSSSYFMTGRDHEGDENKNTKYYFSQFTFDPAYIELQKVEFDIDHGKILSDNPETIISQTYTNNTSIEQEQTYQHTKTLENTSSFTYTGGFKISLEYSYTGGIPEVSQHQITVGAETSHEWSENKTYTESTTYTVELPIKVPAHSTVTASSSITKGSMSVPFTATFKVKDNDDVVTITGTWYGTSTTNIITTVNQTDL